MRQVKISVVISAYNKSREIKRAINSVLFQSFNDLEVVVVDDASDDDTCLIVKSMAVKDERIKLISHENNMGLSQTRMTGLSAATGMYVSFMDADDTLSQNTLNLLYDQILKTQCDVIVMGMRRVNKYLHLKLPFFYPAALFHDEIYNTRELLPLLLGKRGLSLSLCDKLYKRDLLNRSNLKAEKIFMGEDMLLNMRVFNSDAKLSWVDHIGYNWTTGGGSSKTPQELWNEDKKLYLRCVEVLTEINADTEINRNALASGAVEAFVSAIAGLLANPFRSRNKTKAWVARELSLPFWQDVKPCLGDAHKEIDLSDAEAVFAYAGKYLKSHWLYYAASPLLR